MRRIVLGFLFLMAASSGFSQRIYFIYLQTESRQAFFVKMNEKLYSSTASGYLILPRLKDSTYTITIGFADNKTGEQHFTCAVNKKDHGYLIKQFGDKGWGLYDLQTSAVQMAVNNDPKNSVSMTNAPVNGFTELLAKATNDSTIKQKIDFPEEKKAEVVAKAEEKKADTIAHVAVDKVAAVSRQSADSVKKQDVAATKPSTRIESVENTKLPPVSTAKVDSVKKPDVATTKTSTRIEAVENTKPPAVSTAKADTVKKQNNTTKQSIAAIDTKTKQATKTGGDSLPGQDIAAKKDIPVSTPVISKTNTNTLNETENTAKEEVQQASTVAEAAFARTKIIRKSESSTTDGFGATYFDVQGDGSVDTIRILIPNDNKVKLSSTTKTNEGTEIKKDEPAIAAEATVNETKVVAVNNCRLVASDEDFYKLRKKMAGAKSDAAMMAEANKLFKSRCFTTKQLKNLSSLFLGDGGKYNFFDAAYTHVFDKDNFSTLQAELKDDYFINRFNAMIR